MTSTESNPKKQRKPRKPAGKLPPSDGPPLLSGEETRELNHQQVAFLAEYLARPSAPAAAKAVGFHPVYGNMLLHKPEVLKALELARQRLVDRTTVDTPRVLRELARIAFFDVRDLWHPDGRMLEPWEYDDATAACVQSVEIEEIYEYEGQGKHRKKINVGRIKKVKLHPKMTALHDLAEHLGLLVKNVKMSGDVNVNHADRNQIDWDRLPLDLRMQVLDHWQRQLEGPKPGETVVNGSELKPAVEYGLKELSNGEGKRV